MIIPETNIELKWLGHAGFLIAPKGVPSSEGKSSKTIYIDPYEISKEFEDQKADIILITHSHFDHCSFPDIQKIVKDGTRIICPPDCQSKITRFQQQIKIELAQPNQELDFGNVKISAIPAYNIDKPFHQKDEGWLGYLIKFDKAIIYHAGDTDEIPEMQKLTGYKQPNKTFIALLPIGGRYTMTAEEAAGAAKTIKPDIAIPMHYGTIEGTSSETDEFKELCQEENINVEILEKE